MTPKTFATRRTVLSLIALAAGLSTFASAQTAPAVPAAVPP